jgi:DNA polymerase-3 subunit delta
VAGALHAVDYLEHPEQHPPCPVTVLFGEDRFFKRLVIDRLRVQALGAEAEFSQTEFDGANAPLRDVLDELSTIALFGAGGRLVVVEQADEFVSRHRPELEDYVARPNQRSVLLLDVKSWPANTRLYKAVAAGGLHIEASIPPAARLRKWLTAWSQRHHGRKLDADAADLLLELVGNEPGLLDQELAKLSAAATDLRPIATADVETLVGGWRAKTTWDMLDAALAGDAPTALAQLERLLLSGENPVGLLAQIGSSLRRLAAATRLIEQAEALGRRESLRSALEEAGVRPFMLGKSEAQLRQLGRQRAGQLLRWLLESDLALKGDSELPPRMILEKLIVRMARPATAGGAIR